VDPGESFTVTATVVKPALINWKSLVIQFEFPPDNVIVEGPFTSGYNNYAEFSDSQVLVWNLPKWPNKKTRTFQWNVSVIETCYPPPTLDFNVSIVPNYKHRKLDCHASTAFSVSTFTNKCYFVY
jgi:hypothetical protein